MPQWYVALMTTFYYVITSFPLLHVMLSRYWSRLLVIIHLRIGYGVVYEQHVHAHVYKIVLLIVGSIVKNNLIDFITYCM
jgi:hypothetical protein